MGRAGAPDPFAFQEWLKKEDRLAETWAKKAAEGLPAGPGLELPPWDPAGEVAVGGPGLKKHTLQMSRAASAPSLTALWEEMASTRRSLALASPARSPPRPRPRPGRPTCGTRVPVRELCASLLSPPSPDSPSALRTPWASCAGSMMRSEYQSTFGPGAGTEIAAPPDRQPPATPIPEPAASTRAAGASTAAPFAACTKPPGAASSEYRQTFHAGCAFRDEGAAGDDLDADDWLTPPTSPKAGCSGRRRQRPTPSSPPRSSLRSPGSLSSPSSPGSPKFPWAACTGGSASAASTYRETFANFAARVGAPRGIEVDAAAATPMPTPGEEAATAAGGQPFIDLLSADGRSSTCIRPLPGPRAAGPISRSGSLRRTAQTIHF